ncbi:CDP-diacylglycerol--glycerol-3-phosphate 3-phosphatidyltransferase [Varibaculum prostatecancerukia]|uniref:CDP-diacylglycerol--glycerol-3-phosphate 3-phosphatidyltransferase n=1 Tax=Varibaculum prostatecancerukia TaxID=2811781 RepID=UPI001C003B5F|nr:CDP-diacylglycerol--glycerol-3-phosphate 3-phosphatidyltransferase [Varibaculum prostatecancerukia]
MESKEKPAASSETWRKKIPNLLTVLRIILVPVFIALMIAQFLQGTVTLLIIALVVFCVAAYTDHLDGKLARRWGVVSDFGKLVDPIADKALMISAFVLLSLFQNLWWWFTAVVILREVAVTLLRMYLLRSGVVLPASKGGKIKTSLQILMVFLWMLAGICYPFNTQVGVVVMYLAIAALIAAFVATVLSGMVYFLDAHDNHKEQAKTADDQDKSAEADESAAEEDSEETDKSAEADLAAEKDEQAAEKPLKRRRRRKNRAHKHAKIGKGAAELKSKEKAAAVDADGETDSSDEGAEEDQDLIDDFAGFKKTWIPRKKPGEVKPETDKAAEETATVEPVSVAEKSADDSKNAPKVTKSAESAEKTSVTAGGEHKAKFPSRRQRREQQKVQENKDAEAEGDLAEESSKSSIPQAVVNIPDPAASGAAAKNSEDILADENNPEEEADIEKSPELKDKAEGSRFAFSRSEMRRRKKE